jgi:hypothetical protein
MTLPPGCVQSYLVLFLRRSPGACKVQEAEAGREQAVTRLVDLACRQRHSNPSVLAGQPKSTAKGETMPVQIKNRWWEKFPNQSGEAAEARTVHLVGWSWSAYSGQGQIQVTSGRFWGECL